MEDTQIESSMAGLSIFPLFWKKAGMDEIFADLEAHSHAPFDIFGQLLGKFSKGFIEKINNLLDFLGLPEENSEIETKVH